MSEVKLWIEAGKYKRTDPYPQICFDTLLSKIVDKNSFIAYSQESLQKQIDHVLESSVDEEFTYFFYILK